jgi:mono/diheme cytochrome c family protein
MKKFRAVALLFALTGCLMFCRRQTPLYAAHKASPAAASASQAGAETAEVGAGSKVYAADCAICHGDHREGILPGFPPLLGIGRQMKDDQITDIIHQGKDRMPGFPNLEGGELTSLLHFLARADQQSTHPAAVASTVAALSPEAQAGGALFLQNCAFCHGRDTMGGESGPDLTRSKLVRSDVRGNKISEVVRDGRPQKKMPAFNFSAPEILNLAAFIHAEAALAANSKGGRRGVDVSDLQTGNLAAGKQYFAAECARCHSPTGDLAGVATRYEGLELEERMLYPEGAKSKVEVTLPSGKKIAGTLAYLDEFTVALRTDDGTFHSWPISRVRYKVDDPVEAHVDLFPKYTDADIHNLMAYLQTLR